MIGYQAVRSSREISIRIAEILEMLDPIRYTPMNHSNTVREMNDMLQGRSDLRLGEFLAELREKGGADYAGEINFTIRDVNAFLTQKSLRSEPYTKSSFKVYKYRYSDLNSDKPLRIINQRTFDDAAQAGFPTGFFRDSQFENVTIYCVPDGTDFNFSRFHDCTFAVCRIHSACFDGTVFNSCEFHSSDIRHTTFFQSILSHTHFQDSNLAKVSFQGAKLKSCNTRDCIMKNVQYLHATLDGCSFGRVTVSGTRCIETAIINMGGATREECDQNKESILKALQGSKGQHKPKKQNRQR